MYIKYFDKSHAKLIVSFGSGKNRVRRTKNITYRSKRDAERQYREFEDKVKSEMTVNTDLTIEGLLTWYIGRFKLNGGKDTTVRAYKIAKKPIIAYMGSEKAKDVNLFKVEKFIASETKSRAPKTIKNEVSLLSSAYKQAIRRGMLNENPCEYAVIPKQVKPTIDILSTDEIRAFLAALDSAAIDFKVMCELALFCGLRKSEILCLHSDDVGETVTISKVRHRINGEDVIQPPKTPTSNRTLAVPAFILDDIKKMQEEQKARPSSCEYLIRNKWGEAPGAAWCDKRMKELIKGNQLPHITMHGLRHTYASMLIAEGVPVSEVSAQLGHASVDITLRVYTHLFVQATTASKAISDAINAKWAPNGHLATIKNPQDVENAVDKCGADERIRT